MAARAKKPALVAAAPVAAKRKPRKKALVMDEPQIFRFADGVRVIIEWPLDAMPEWLPNFNLIIMAAGAAKGGDVPTVGMPQFVPSMGARMPMSEEPRTNLTNMAGFNMTAGTMDPKEALKGIPGLTETQKAVMRTLDAVESSVDESQLGDIPDEEELSPEEIGIPETEYDKAVRDQFGHGGRPEDWPS